MRQFLTRTLPVFVLMLSYSAGFAADGKTNPATQPKTNNGQRWRIGYMEGGSYQDYQALLKAFVENLADMGWIEKQAFPETLDEKETGTIWSWLATDVRSEYLEFVRDAYWAGEWNEELYRQHGDNAFARFNEKKDIDLMLAFGTRAGQNFYMKKILKGTRRNVVRHVQISKLRI